MKIELSRIVGLLATMPLVFGALSASAAPVLTSSWQTLNEGQYRTVTFADEDEPPLEPQAESDGQAFSGADCACAGVGCNVCCPPRRFWVRRSRVGVLGPELQVHAHQFAATDLINSVTDVRSIQDAEPLRTSFTPPRGCGSAFKASVGAWWGVTGRCRRRNCPLRH